MKINALGHVVLKVTDLERAEDFYNGLLGLPVCARFDQDGYEMTFFSLGNHHDFAIMKVDGGDNDQDEDRIGLHHVAFNIGTSLDDLREAKTKLDNAGVSAEPIDHEVTVAPATGSPSSVNDSTSKDRSSPALRNSRSAVRNTSYGPPKSSRST